ncbi:MAG: adenosylcobinamide-GDP ribazoletransferase [Actinobacteria bacterium]|nr:adenosylcobinamide-GDP ribazoletransferase [Actinomycetota bacterium]
MGKKIINAFGFLTVFKIPASIAMDEKEVSGSVLYFPLVGLMLGIFISFSFFVLNHFLPILVTVLLVLILEVTLTGAAHLDGLADMFDGIFSGKRNKDKILEIMKKSDVGVFGILSIVFLIILKTALIYYLFLSSHSSYLSDYRGTFYFYATLIFMPAFGRWSMNYLLASYKNARSGSSLTKIFTESKQRRKYFVISTIYLFIAFAIFTAGGWYLTTIFAGGVIPVSIIEDTSFFTQLLPVLAGVFSVIVSAILSIIFLGWFFTRRIGGITGDIIGGSSEIIEVIILLISYLVLNYLCY